MSGLRSMKGGPTAVKTYIEQAIWHSKQFRQKTLEQQLTDLLDEVTKYFEDDSKKFMVKKLEWSSTVNKAISEAIKTVSGPKSALKDRSVYLFSASPEEGKVVHGCYVSEVCRPPLLFPFLLLWQRLLTYTT